MARKVYKNLGARISKVRERRSRKSEDAAKVVVVPEIRTVPVSARVTKVNLGSSMGGGGPTIVSPRVALGGSEEGQKAQKGGRFKAAIGVPLMSSGRGYEGGYQSADSGEQVPEGEVQSPMVSARGGMVPSTAPATPVPIPMPGPMGYGSGQVIQRESILRERYEPISLNIIEKDLPMFEKETGEMTEKLQAINENYPLVSMRFKGKKVAVAWANIRWDPTTHSLLYSTIEPRINEKEAEKLKEIKSLLRDKLDIDFSKVKLESSYKYLMRKFSEITKELNIRMDDKTKVKFQYYLFRDFVGLGFIEPLMHDPNIEDISCDGTNIPIFIYHRNPTYGQLRTNIVFKGKDELDSFVLKLAQKSGRTLTIAQPLLDGALPDGSRVQATLGTDIARKGSNFTIRKFPENPMTPVDLMDYGTASAEMLAYLWLCIENRLSVLVCGPTATGKTTFLNGLSLFIKPELKVVSIEDTPELQLPHSNWIPAVARTGFGIKGYGDVTMFDLLKSSLRQRPDYVIVGEVRGEEAYVMFQGMATGHPGLGTLHADSLPAVIDRLTTKPIDLPMAMLENLDLVVFLMLTKRKGYYIRRVSEIVEVIGYDYTMKDLITNNSFRWDPMKDEFVLMKSVLLDKIRERMGFTVEELKREMGRRVKILKWLKENNVKDYVKFAKIVGAYYTNPQFVAEILKGEAVI
jgi:flagellar protein FlaI